jgi:F-type H+-transporting ATPase subunit gamma
MALKALKTQIRAVERTKKVTKAMEAVSAAKMRKSQERALNNRRAVEAALLALESLPQESGTEAVGGKELILLITSDRGLSGGMNAKLERQLHAYVGRGGEYDVIAYGKKGEEMARRMGLAVIEKQTALSDDLSFDVFLPLLASLPQHMKTGGYVRATLAFTVFRSTFEQEPAIVPLLPLTRARAEEVLLGIIPEKGRWSDEQVSIRTIAPYTVEPSPEEVRAALMPILIALVAYHALLEGKASEHSARMVAMKNATEKAGERSHALTRSYNRERQAAITREVSEIIGGIEALA